MVVIQEMVRVGSDLIRIIKTKDLENLFKGFKAKKSAMFMLALLALQGSAGISKVSADTVAENVNVSSDYVKVNSSTGVHDVGKITIKTNGKEELAFCIEPDVITPPRKENWDWRPLYA